MVSLFLPRDLTNIVKSYQHDFSIFIIGAKIAARYSHWDVFMVDVYGESLGYYHTSFYRHVYWHKDMLDNIILYNLDHPYLRGVEIRGSEWNDNNVITADYMFNRIKYSWVGLYEGEVEAVYICEILDNKLNVQRYHDFESAFARINYYLHDYLRLGERKLLAPTPYVRW